MARAEMAELLGFSFHRGTLALADRPKPPDPAALRAGHALVLWNVTDPDNLGALIRSAAALGASRVCLGPGCADPYSRKSLRASMACALSLPIVPLAGIADLNLARGLPLAESAGNILVAAALVPEARSPVTIASTGRYVSLVLGNEGWGLPDEVVAACDCSVAVPMAGNVDSLNVGAAGAILMWELYRH
jgi:tRNA G18 (ribose-2'-O)-methylase SpoU